MRLRLTLLPLLAWHLQVWQALAHFQCNICMALLVIVWSSQLP